MITGFFISILTAAMHSLNGLWDSMAAGIPLNFAQNPSLLGFVSYMWQANHFFPIDLYLFFAGVFFSVEVVMLAVKIFKVFYDAVPGGQKLNIFSGS